MPRAGKSLHGDIKDDRKFVICFFLIFLRLSYATHIHEIKAAKTLLCITYILMELKKIYNEYCFDDRYANLICG